MVPGNAIDPDDQPDAQVENAPFGADYSTFRSADWWARHFRRTGGIEVTHAEMLPNGHELWVQHERARSAFTGVPFEQSDDRGSWRTLRRWASSASLPARTDDETIRFGPGRFTDEDRLTLPANRRE